MDAKGLAAVDRIASDVAVIEPLDGGPAFEADAALLPEGTGEGDCVSFVIEGGEISFHPAPDGTERRRAAVRSKLDRLRSRGT